jgi:NADP-dependent alcohol dehydrogenase
MRNFSYHNPTRVFFGRGCVAELASVLAGQGKILVTYGQGSVKRNGVWDQVMAATSDLEVLTFGGIEPNPDFSTLMRAADICRLEGVQFLLAVGGGSVLDGTKFIAAAAHFDGDPWTILSQHAAIEHAIPLGSVLTLPATGSESNTSSVVSRREMGTKLFFASPSVHPTFAFLDPATTFTLPERQTVNGIVDAFVHVVEQYLTFDVDTPLQDRQAEAILQTLVQEGPKVLTNPEDYDARANIMWSATQALSGLIGCGVVQDWSTHMIGHELTALWGLDHGQSLAVVLPGVLRHQRDKKLGKLTQFGTRVWGLSEAASAEQLAEEAIDRMVGFFHAIKMPTAPGHYGIPDGGFAQVADRLQMRGMRLGEHVDIGRDEVIAIGRLCG